MKKYSGLLVLLLLMACVIAVSGCGGGGGGGGSKVSSDDGDRTNAQGAIESFYRLTDSAATTELANWVSIIFHVEDSLGKYDSLLTADDFEVLDDGEPLSSTESTSSITSMNKIPYKLYYVLMIDNSTSSESNLDSIKSAAKEMIPEYYNDKMVYTYANSITTFFYAPGIHGYNGTDTSELLDRTFSEYYQVYSFSSGTYHKMMPDFSNDVAAIKAAIESIEPGGDSTDLFGSVIEGVSEWSDGFTNELVEEGVLVLFTDGIDTSESSTLDAALDARGDKRIITAGVGIGKDDEIAKNYLKQLGNAGCYYFIEQTEDDETEVDETEVDETEVDEKLVVEVADINSLSEKVGNKCLEIMSDIIDFSSSFYRMTYASPKRGNETHTLSITINENKNEDPGNGGEISSDYECKDFFTPQEGIYINNVLPTSDDEYFVNISSKEGVRTKIRFDEYFNKNLPGTMPATPEYSISNLDTINMTMTQDPADPSVFRFIAVEDDSLVMTMTQDPADPSVFTIRTYQNSLCNIAVTDANNKYSDGEKKDLDFSQSFKIYITDYGTPGNGLVAHYAFEGEGDISDSSGNGNDARDSHVAFEADRFGVANNAIKIEDDNGFLEIPLSASRNSMTVSMWHKAGLVLDEPNTILGSNNSEYHHLSIRNGDNRVGFYNDGWILSDVSLTYNYMYHIVLVKDGSNSKLYIHEITKSYPDGPNLVLESNESFENDSYPLSFIGNRGGLTQDQGARGIIDDVRIYDRVLSESEIEGLFQEK